MDVASEVHRSLIEVLVAHAAPHCASFGELLDRLPGVYPGEAVAALDRLSALRLVDPKTWTQLDPAAQPADDGGGLGGEANDGLPRPHPLDYDWRFAQLTVCGLLERCLELSHVGDTIALLGTPSLLRGAARSPAGRRWVLMEASPATTAALAQLAPGDVVRCDLGRDDLPALTAQVVVADPPWYPAHTRVFLWAAACLTPPGATVLLAQPAIATRPGVLTERADILAWAQATGLETTRILTSGLTYASPPFERQALHAASLDCVPSCWRRGDLIELRRISAPDSAQPDLDDPERWDEVLLVGARIRFRLDRPSPTDGPVDPRLVRLVDGDVLTSVSRRDPLRHRVVVWTGANRVFASTAPQLLAVIATALAADQPIIPASATYLGRDLTASEVRVVVAAARQLRELAQAETSTNKIVAAGADSIGDLGQGDPSAAALVPQSVVSVNPACRQGACQ